MTTESSIDVVAVDSPAADDNTSYVDWPAIIGGIVLASAISILLLTFGSAVGLGLTDFNAREGASPVWIAIAAASWLIWVQVSSFMAGGYLTGRMRRRHHDATEDESDVRDGAHGLLVWAGALIVGAVLAVSGVGALASAVGSAAATVTQAAATAAGPAAGAAADALDPNAYFVDMLFRPAAETAPADSTAETEPAAEAPATPAETPDAATGTAPGASPAAPGTTGDGLAAPATSPAPLAEPSAATPAPASAQSRDAELVRGEATRIFARAATGELPDADRTYLAQLVAEQSGLSEEEAAARVDEVTTAMDEAAAQAVEVAEEARKMTVIGAFIVAASFLVSAIGAFWAAQKGGDHRDKRTVFPGVFRRF